MERGEVSDSLPIDLLLEILSRLPIKSVGRFRLVSKLWCDMLHRPYFTDLFLTRSRAHPRLLFARRGGRLDEWTFYSSPQNVYDKSCATVHTKFNMSGEFCGHTSGLLLFSCTWKGEGYNCLDASRDVVHVILNPNTGQHVSLPRVTDHSKSYSFLGFDPIDKQYKVLFMAYPSSDNYFEILTLGDGELMWRKVRCPFTHKPFQKNYRNKKAVCIDGLLYYLAKRSDEGYYGVACFDVRSETFKFIDSECCTFYDELINYKGKLSGMYWEYVDVDGIEMHHLNMWVLQDAEKPEWKIYGYTFEDGPGMCPVAGSTATGEIVFVEEYNTPFIVYYFNPERNTLQSVEIRGFGKSAAYTFVNHVEDLNAYDVKQSKFDPDLNVIRKMPINTTRRRRIIRRE